MRKRFALWLCPELARSIATATSLYLSASKELAENNRVMLAQHSELNDLRNKIAELQRPAETHLEFKSGRAIPRFARGERPRQGVTQ